MGFFSWNCAKSKKPVMSEYAVSGSPWEFSSKVVVLFKNGDRISGTYDGYGRVGAFNIYEISESSWRMIISDFYDGETFNQFEPNEYDPKQGYFYDDDELRDIFGSGICID